MESSLRQAADALRQSDRVLILCHQYPDGDTIGSAAALCLALRRLGKQAQIACSDPFPPKFQNLLEGLPPQRFEPQTVVAVDIAAPQLLGEKTARYADRVDWCIDHHASNVHYAAHSVVDPTAAATAELIAALVEMMEVPVDPQIARCIYTGITTDTGCFRYTNATPRTYRIAADMMEKGADAAAINRVMFDIKSRERLELERRVLDGMEFYFDGRCAVICVTEQMMRDAGAGENDTDGLAAMPRQVEGVQAGVTLREKADGSFKISLRTDASINASAICAQFGGGGHSAAAGCTLCGTADEAKAQIVQAVGKALART